MLLELSSPRVAQECLAAAAQLLEAEAHLANLRVQPENQHLTQESVIADLDGQPLQAKAQSEAHLVPSKEGLTNQVPLKKSPVPMDPLHK